MRVQLRLTLLGGFAGELVDGRPLDLSARKAQALLAYLALPPGQLHPRDKLAALLWGDVPDAQARASLRQALSALRQALRGPDVLHADGEAVRLAADTVATDVGLFERDAAAGTEALSRAATLYRGDLLAGLRVTAPAFEEWLLAERERLRELAQEVLARLLAHQRDAGAVESALQTGLRLLALDPLQEPVHRALMRLYIRLGRRASALRQYQECLGVLQRELGVEPEPETRQLYQQILRQSPLSALRSVERPLAVAPLVGRRDELARLGAALVDAWTERGRFVAILGEAGIGKSRLVEELTEKVTQRGGRVLLGRARETMQGLPFGPWIDALRTDALIGEAGTVFALEPVWRAELGRLFPELGGPRRELSTAPENALRLFEGVFRLLHQAAEREPLGLILEDLHWADDPSLRLLSFLAARLTTQPILLVVTAREEELSGAPLLRQLLQEREAAQSRVTIPLAPLSEADTQTLARTLGPLGREALSPQMEARVWAFSRGNPFMVVEALRALRDASPAGAGDALPFPERVREVVAARFQRLSDRARDLLLFAAVIGHAIPFRLLLLAAGLAEDEAAAGVEELVRCRVLAAVGDQFEFTHDRLQEVAYASLLAPRRQALHAAVGGAFERLHADRLDAVSDRLAYHYAHAAESAKAVEYLQSFAEQAAWRYAHDEAVEALKEALVHVERLPAPERDRRLVAVLIQLANSLFVLLRLKEIVDSLLPYRDRAEALQDPRLRATYYFWLGHGYAALVDQEPARRIGQRALEEAMRSGDEITAGQAHMLLAWIAWLAGEPATGAAHANDAITHLKGRADLQYWLSMAYWALGANHSLLGEFDPALDALARAEAVARAIGNRLIQAAARWIRVDIHARRAEWERAIVESRAALEELSHPVEAPFFIPAFLGWALCERGDVTEGIAVLERNREHLRGMENFPIQARTIVSLSEGYLLSGRLDKARELAAEGFEIASRLNFRYVVGMAQRTLGRIALAAGALDEAARHLSQALETFAAIPAPLEMALTRLDLAEVAAAGDHRTAVAPHLHAAREALSALDAPRRVEQAERLALRLGLPLA